MRAVSLTCSLCGAPLSFASGQQLAICRYCYATSRLVGETTQAGEQEAAVVPSVAKDIGQRVVDLVIDGRRNEAIQLFAQHSGLDPAAAERSVDEVLGPHLARLTRRAPLTLNGMLRLGCVTIGLWLVVAAGGVALILSGHSWGWILALLGAAMATVGILITVPRVTSRWVATHGRLGLGRLLRIAVLRPNFAPGGALVLVDFEVTPEDGSPAFRDDEALLVANESLSKLLPGNLLRVRYDRNRTRVFPTVPMEVLGNAQGR
jgi:hypothetical protein